jgi:hypothetical protein
MEYMTEKYQFPPERWSYGLTDDMLGKQGKLSQRNLLTKPTQDRTVAERMHRAENYEAILDKRRGLKQAISDDDIEETSKLNLEIKNILNVAKSRGEIYFNFLNGIKPISVDIGKLGIQEANYVDLKFKDTDLTKPPIIFIPGISNDINGTGEFSLELALISKRRVIMFTYPESPQGKVTNKFARAVLKSGHFETHVDFFKKAINQVVGENTSFDICGVSAGSIMVSEISKDKKFSDRIDKINLIVPPGITAINPLDIKKRLKMNSDSIKKIEEDGSVGRLMVTNVKFLNRTKEDIKAAEWTFRFLTLKLTQEYKWWEGMDKARVIVAKGDGITYGIKNIDKLNSNPNLSLEVIDGGHEVAAVNPEEVIKKMVF